jgi:hypothetical protein
MRAYFTSKAGAAQSELAEQRFVEERKALLTELRRKSHIQVYDARLQKLIPDYYKSRIEKRSVAPCDSSTTGSRTAKQNGLISRPAPTPTPKPGVLKSIFGPRAK